LRLIGACSDCLFLFLRSISRQFIARYVHDLIVKHNVRDLSDYPDQALTFIYDAAQAVMGRER
jgi:hypothetical protein